MSEIKIKSNTVLGNHRLEKIQIRVWRIQTQIYNCSLKCETIRVIRLQKTLLEAKFLAVRKVTQGNRVKRLYEVDGVKLLIPSKRLSSVASTRTFSAVNEKLMDTINEVV